MAEATVTETLVGGLPMATNAPGPLRLIFDSPLPPSEFRRDEHHDEFLRRHREFYAGHATRLADALFIHAPGGFVDALLGELLHRKASIFRVTVKG